MTVNSEIKMVDISNEVSRSNYSGRSGDKIDMLVMHITECPLDDARRELTVGSRRVSAHYLIARDGTIYRLVPEEKRAHHAGESRWKLATGEEISNINSRSIGIEFECQTGQQLTPAQTKAGLALSKQITQKYGIHPHDVVGHCDIAPDRKSDPDQNFPWELFQQAGIAQNGARRGGGRVDKSYLATAEYAQAKEFAELVRAGKEKKQRAEENAMLAQQNAQQNLSAPEPEISMGGMIGGLAQTAMKFTDNGTLKLALLGVALLGDLSKTMPDTDTGKGVTQTLNAAQTSGETQGAGATLGQAGQMVSNTPSETSVAQAVSSVNNMV